jgi:hypothetical protein
MKRAILTLAVALLALAQASNADADEVFNKMRPDQKNRVYATLAYDPGFMVGVGYARGFEIEPIKRMLTLTADVSFPMFVLDFDHYKIDIGSRFALFDSEWNIINRLSVINKGTDNPVFSGNTLSIEEGLLGGYFAEKWFVAVEANYEKYLLTYLEHSDYYRRIYPEVKDGWYSSTGGKWRFALQAGYTIADRVELALRAGTFWSERFNEPVATMPIFADVAVNVHF